MITVKIFGTFRLDSGIKEMQAEAGRVKELYPLVLAEAVRRNPDTTLTIEDIKSCLVSVNGKAARPGTKLSDGDLVYLIPAVAGG